MKYRVIKKSCNPYYLHTLHTEKHKTFVQGNIYDNNDALQCKWCRVLGSWPWDIHCLLYECKPSRKKVNIQWCSFIFEQGTLPHTDLPNAYALAFLGYFVPNKLKVFQLTEYFCETMSINKNQSKGNMCCKERVHFQYISFLCMLQYHGKYW
jgi:hypothetical protein